METFHPIINKVNNGNRGFGLSADLFETALTIHVSGNLKTENSDYFLNSILEIINNSGIKTFIMGLKEMNYS